MEADADAKYDRVIELDLSSLEPLAAAPHSPGNVKKISELEGMGIGGVIGLLWFKKELPDYARKFLEISLQLVADHGPAVSGAHNAIVASRAGKDIISSLVSGLLTIGPRFGGAIDGAAQNFKRALESGLTPEQFVKEMKAKDTPIPGIGHKVKSLTNPDMAGFSKLLPRHRRNK